MQPTALIPRVEIYLRKNAILEQFIRETEIEYSIVNLLDDLSIRHRFFSLRKEIIIEPD
jgi:hypothetical protein